MSFYVHTRYEGTSYEIIVLYTITTINQCNGRRRLVLRLDQPWAVEERSENAMQNRHIAAGRRRQAPEVGPTQPPHRAPQNQVVNTGR